MRNDTASEQLQQQLSALVAGIQAALAQGSAFKTIVPGPVQEHFAFARKQLERSGVQTESRYIAHDLWTLSAWRQ